MDDFASGPPPLPPPGPALSRSFAWFGRRVRETLFGTLALSSFGRFASKGVRSAQDRAETNMEAPMRGTMAMFTVLSLSGCGQPEDVESKRIGGGTAPGATDVK